MNIELTEQQQQAIDAQGQGSLRVVDPRTNTAYVLVPAEDYESLREELEDKRLQRAIRAAGMRNAGRRLKEDQ